jgi:hypothetical protein
MLDTDVIRKTLDMSQLTDGFWARWLVHGLSRDDLAKVRSHCTTLQGWTQHWSRLACEKESLAVSLENDGHTRDAEYTYRIASLYYNLTQWIYPVPTDQKRKWMKKCQELFQHADLLSSIPALYSSFKVGGHTCHGRIRVPEHPKGCVVIINPIDSSKEELFLYERDFIQADLATVSFDGPGQGGNYVFQGRKTTQREIQLFVDHLIHFASSLFPTCPLFLFGTSSGGGWALYGSGNPKVAKAVAVSPAIEFDKMHFSEYFKGRLYSYLEDDGAPADSSLLFLRPVFMFHGGRDRMVPEEALLRLYDRLPEGKRFVEYPDEAHCCNFKIPEIRQLSIHWFLDNGDEEIPGSLKDIKIPS